MVLDADARDRPRGSTLRQYLDSTILLAVHDCQASFATNKSNRSSLDALRTQHGPKLRKRLLALLNWRRRFRWHMRVRLCLQQSNRAAGAEREAPPRNHHNRRHPKRSAALLALGKWIGGQLEQPAIGTDLGVRRAGRQGENVARSAHRPQAARGAKGEKLSSWSDVD
jgi:hypothetical protein